MDELLAQHLYIRERSKPNLNLDEAILGDDETLGAVAGAWRDRKQAISLVIGAQIAHIEHYMITDMLPMETTVMRQCLVELEAVLTLFEKYDGEFTRREKAQKGAPKPEDNVSHDEPAL